MHGDARGLVEHQQARIFMDDGAFELLDERGGHAPRGVRCNLVHRRQAHGIARREPLLGAGPPSVHADLAAADQAEYTAARYAQQPLAQHPVQPLAGALGVNLHVPHRRLHGGADGLFELRQNALRLAPNA